MIALLAPRPSARRAADILRQVFGHIPVAFAFRLWDGTEVPIGEGAPAFAAVIKSPETFTRLIRDPSPLNFAEAYVEGAIDVEGDLFRAMTAADAIEELRLSPGQRFRILLSLHGG
jgi:cyclopropane-fatty-acyl-phospholipid synthase